jgi:hypothetical protein
MNYSLYPNIGANTCPPPEDCYEANKPCFSNREQGFVLFRQKSNRELTPFNTGSTRVSISNGVNLIIGEEVTC